jgi:hypothetical protein
MICVLVFGVLGGAIFKLRKNDGPGPSVKLPTTAPVEVNESRGAHQHRPQQVVSDGYVSSSECRECHEHNHDTWYASYHRTMTQVASTNTVAANFENVSYTIPHKGETIRLNREGNQFFAQLPAYRSLVADQPPDERGYPVVMTTGSHHSQAYWFSLERSRAVALLPLMYLKEADRWLPRESIFLSPPGIPTSVEIGRWNKACLNCHSTHPDSAPRRDKGQLRYDTTVGEFGIACEACHGAAGEHVTLHRNARESGTAVVNDPIVNPINLNHERSTEVCGQCHSVHASHPLPGKAANEVQKLYRPGDVLEDTRLVIRGRGEQRKIATKIITDNKMDVTQYFRERFWDDGSIRLAGREYNGLIESACHTAGELTCLSCHQLHQSKTDSRTVKSWANDQLSPEALGDQACLQCHDSSDYQTPKHTHHPAGSSGSVCYNCHMPHTTYGLLKGIRSHTIDSPSVANTVEFRRPNACNLCHLDQTLEWTATHLKDWFNHPVPKLNQSQKSVAAAVLGATQGDGGERALIAWHMGWEPARQVSGTRWLAPYLTMLMQDPYEAIRYIAGRSLKSLPGYSGLEFDFLAPPQTREAELIRALGIWQETDRSNVRNHPELLLDANGDRLLDELTRLISGRDNRPISLSE